MNNKLAYLLIGLLTLGLIGSFIFSYSLYQKIEDKEVEIEETKTESEDQMTDEDNSGDLSNSESDTDVEKDDTPTPETDHVVVSPYVYNNVVLRFNITLPDSDWFVPTKTDEDPHFYENSDCAYNYYRDCIAFEIIDRNYNDPIDGSATQIYSDDSKQIFVQDYFGPGGWAYEYRIKLKNYNMQFLVNASDHRDILEPIIWTLDSYTLNNR